MRARNGGVAFNVHGLASSGQAKLRAQVAGIGQVESTVRLGPSGLAFTADTLVVPFASPTGAVSINTYLLDDLTGIPLEVQPLRPGVQVSTSLRQEGTSISLQQTEVVWDSRSSSPTRSVPYRLVETGETAVSVEQPAGFTAPSRRARAIVRVVPATIRVTGDGLVAKNAMTSLEARIESSSSSQPEFTATSLDPSRLLLSATGTDSGSTTVMFRGRVLVYGLTDEGVGTVRITSPNTAPVEVNVRLVPLRVALSGPQAGMNMMLAQTGALSWRIGLFSDENGYSSAMALRPGSAPVRVDLTSSNPGVITVRPPAVEFRPGGQPQAEVQVVPSGPGEAEIRFQVSGEAVLNRDRVAVAVRSPRLTVALDLIRGSGLVAAKDLQGSISLIAEGGRSPQDNVLLTVASSSPERLLLSRTATSAPAASITVAFGAGQRESQPFFVHALAGQGEVSLRVTADGYAESILPVTLVPAAVVLNQTETRYPMQLGSEGQALAVRLAPLLSTASATLAYPPIFAVRMGSAPVVVPISVSNSSIATTQPQQLVFDAGAASQTFTVKPLAIGSAEIVLGVPNGFGEVAPVARTAPIDVVGRPFNVVGCSVDRLGKNMQTSCTIIFPTGVPISVASSDATRLLVSADASAVGSGRLDITSAAGGAQIHVQALGEDGNVQITLNASGHQEHRIPFRLFRSAFILEDSFGNSPLSPGASRELRVHVTPIENATVLGAFGTTLRPGVGPVTLDVTSSAPGVARVNGGALTFGTGESTKSLRLEAVAPGSTVVSISTPSGFVASPHPSVLYEVR